MLTKSLLTTLLITALTASARVVNMTAPSSAAPGTNINAVLYTAGFIQNYDDFGVAWGLLADSFGLDEGGIGARVSYDDLLGDTALSGHVGNATFQVPIPSYQPEGEYNLVAGIPYLVGASGEMAVKFYRSNITIKA